MNVGYRILIDLKFINRYIIKGYLMLEKNDFHLLYIYKWNKQEERHCR